jgi:CubicO group peptidase (beta-lactamase class C family)
MSLLKRRKGSTEQHFVVSHFDAYQDGDLAQTEMAVYEQHLQTCRVCRKWAQRQESLAGQLNVEMAPAAVLAPAAAARIQENLYSAMRRAVIMNNVRTSVAAVGALAVLALVVGMAAWWQSGDSGSAENGSAVAQEPAAQETTIAAGAAPTRPTEAQPAGELAAETAPVEILPLPDALDSALAQEMDAFLQAETEAGRFSGAVLIMKDGDVLVKKGYGLADREQNMPVTTDTRFPLGGATAAFTATAVMKLAEQGRLDVSDSICIYLDDCPPAWEAVTIQYLLNGSSGILEANAARYYDLISGAEEATETVVRVVQTSKLNYEPGTASSGLRGIDYALLGLIIEKASGQPYASYLQANIFDPLGMAGTGLWTEGDGVAIGYRDDSARPRTVLQSPVSYAATDGLASTIEDMARFAQALMSDQLLSAASKEHMFAPYFHMEWEGHPIDIASGWFIEPLDKNNSDLYLSTYTGDWEPEDRYLADLALYRDNGLIHAFLVNQGDVNLDAVVVPLEAMALGIDLE